MRRSPHHRTPPTPTCQRPRAPFYSRRAAACRHLAAAHSCFNSDVGRVDVGAAKVI